MREAVFTSARKALLLRFAALTVIPLVLVAVGIVGWTAYVIRGANPQISIEHGKFTSLAWSPNCKYLVTGSGDKTVKVWDVASGLLLKSLYGHSLGVTSVAWSPDGRYLASGSEDKSIILWSVDSGKRVRTFTGHSLGVSSVAWSPDSSRLASSSLDKSTKVWAVDTGRELENLLAHGEGVTSVAWSARGELLATASLDKTVKIWDLGHLSGSPPKTLRGHSSAVSVVAWSPDGAQLASGGDAGTVNLWDVESEQVLRTLGRSSPSIVPTSQRTHVGTTVRGEVMMLMTSADSSPPVSTISWHPDGKLIAGAGALKSAAIWSVEEKRVERTIEGALRSIWSLDGTKMASICSDGTVKISDWKTGRITQTIYGGAEDVASVAWSPDGLSLASGGGNAVRVWDSRRGNLRRELLGHESEVFAIAWSPDGKNLASASFDTTVRVWDVEASRLLFTLRGHQSKVFAVAWSPDGRRLASGGEDGVTRLWDITNGQLRAELPGDGTGTYSIAWSPDSKLLATAGENFVLNVWSVESHSLVRTIQGHGLSIHAIAWSPDGASIASASDDYSVRLWDVLSGQQRSMVRGHSPATSVKWRPNGDLIASGWWDGRISVNEASTVQPVLEQRGFAGYVRSVAWSPEGKRLAGGSVDGTIRIRDLASSEILFLANLPKPKARFVMNQSNLRYECNDGQDDFVTIASEHGEFSPHKMSEFRDHLRVPAIAETLGKSADFSTLPILWVESTAFVRRNQITFAAGAALYLIGLVVSLVLRSPATPAQVSQRFFPAAGYSIEKALTPNLLALTGTESGYAAVWPQPEVALIESIARHRIGMKGRFRTYLVWQEGDPEAANRLSQRLGCVVIPLSAAGLERALADGKAKETLSEMEDPFLARPDPYNEARAITDATWFYGRKSQLEELPAVLRQGQHVGVFGLRKVGKTSLVNQLRLRMLDVPVVWLDCQAYSPVALDLLRDILGKLRGEVLRLRGSTPPAEARAESLKEVREQLRRLHGFWKQKSGERFILILDEVDKWFPDRRDERHRETLREYVKLFRMLRALSQEQDMFGVLVVAYRPDVNRQNRLPAAGEENPMYLSFQERYLGFLNEADTRKMIREIGSWKEIQWTEEALGAVYESCGGHPLLSRLLASDACKQGKRKQVGLAEVEENCARIRRNFPKHLIGKYFAESVWEALGAEEQEALVDCARGGGSAARKEWEEALVNLEHFGLIDEGHAVQGSLLRDWLLRRVG